MSRLFNAGKPGPAAITFEHNLTPLVRDAVAQAEQMYPGVKFAATAEMTADEKTGDIKFVIVVMPEVHLGVNEENPL